MEDTEIYGENTKDIPGFKTIIALEKRRNYILKKLERNEIENESYYQYLIEEIRALERANNFIKWIRNNLEDDTVKEIIKKYEMENRNTVDEENEIETDNKKEPVVYGIMDERQNRNHKFEIILSKRDGINYISISSQRRKNNNVLWRKTKIVKMTINKLEKILRIAKEKETDGGNH